MEPVAHYTHIQNARAENAIRVAKEHIRCLLRASNLPKIFWPYALMHFLRMRAYWPSDPHNRSAWERLDAISPGHKIRHNLAADLHSTLQTSSCGASSIKRSTPCLTPAISILFCLFFNRVMSVIKLISLSMILQRCMRHPPLVSLPRPRSFKLDRVAQVLWCRSLQLLPRHQIRGRMYHFLIRGSKE